MSNSIEDILNQDHIFKDIDELAEVVKTKFDDLEALVIIWGDGDSLHHRAYGTVKDIVGLLERAKYIVLRENTGDTRNNR